MWLQSDLFQASFVINKKKEYTYYRNECNIVKSLFENFCLRILGVTGKISVLNKYSILFITDPDNSKRTDRKFSP